MPFIFVFGRIEISVVGSMRPWGGVLRERPVLRG